MWEYLPLSLALLVFWLWGSILPLTVSLSPYLGGPHESWLAEVMLISCCYSSWVYSNCLLLDILQMSIAINFSPMGTQHLFLFLNPISSWVTPTAFLQWRFVSYPPALKLLCFLCFHRLFYHVLEASCPLVLSHLPFPEHVGQLHFIFCSLGVEPLFSGKVWYSHG